MGSWRLLELIFHSLLNDVVTAYCMLSACFIAPIDPSP